MSAAPTPRSGDDEIAHRLAYLLVFRVAVATALLVLTIAADLGDWALRYMSPLLYAVVGGTYLVVFVLGVLLRAHVNAVVLATTHLASTVLATLVIVHGTGGVHSVFSFLYMLAVVDGAIVGGRVVALSVASACSLVFGGQLVAELYGWIPSPTQEIAAPEAFVSAVLAHIPGFFLMAWLSGHLATLWQRERLQVSSMQSDLAAMSADLAAKERLASIGELAAAIGHEIRNPLAAVSGAVEMLLQSRDPATQERLRAIVSREVERLNTLLNDFLLYARPAPPQRMRVNLTALVKDTRDTMRQDPLLRRARVEVQGPDIEALLDPAQMQQVLWNLLKNAVEASPEGSLVRVRLERRDREVCVEVEDQGSGLDPRIRPHLFEPFRTTKVGGTGLGLALVHRIITAHGGRIETEAPPTGGTCFRVVVGEVAG